MKTWNLPQELVEYIYDYDDTIIKYYKHIVMPHLLYHIREKLFRKLVDYKDDYVQIYNTLSSDGFPLFLFYQYEPFYKLDQKFFNRYFRRIIFWDLFKHQQWESAANYLQGI